MESTNTTYKKSRWIYDFKKDKSVALFNSCSLEIFFPDNETINLLNQFNTPQVLASVISLFPGKKQGVVKKMLVRFIKDSFLVPVETDEIKLLSNLVKKEVDNKKNEFGKTITLNALRIILTEKCDLRCKYCFVRGKKDISLKDMDEKILIKGIDFLASLNKNKSIELQFFGGEPVIKFDLIMKAVRYANELIKKGIISKAYYGITTNATLIDDNMAKFFKKNNILVSVSLDGWKKNNDENRIYADGKGSYEDTSRGLALLKKYKNDVGILVTPSKDNIRHLAKSCEFIVKKLGFKFITINTPQPNNGDWEIDGRRFSEELKKCHKIALKSKAIINHFGTRTLFSLNLRQPMIFSCSKYGNNYTATLTTNGKLSPCIVSWEYKQILTELEKFKNSQVFLDWKLTEPYFLKKCRQCPAMNVCGGPCPLEIYEMKKTSKKKDYERCNFFRDYLKWAIWFD